VGKRFQLIWALPFAALAIASCGGESAPTPAPAPSPSPTPTPAPAPYPVGLSESTITIGSVERRFLVHVPAGITTPRAIIVVLHGGGGSGAQAANLTVSPQAVFRNVADRERAIAVFPTALESNWNDCRDDAISIGNGSQDVDFLDALLNRLGREYGIDSRRMLMTGTSNGALMSMRFAFERSDRIAAIAISSGNLPLNPEPGTCTTGPPRAVPILMTHGTIDPLVPYNGGCVALPITQVCIQGRVISAEATRDRWLALNNLAGTTPLTATFNPTPDDGGAAVQSRYPGASPVEWWQLQGAGHSPPSRTVFLDRNESGIQNRDVEFAEIAWTFFAARLP
jgi:polyhydroxybutyrate depolymerase